MKGDTHIEIRPGYFQSFNDLPPSRDQTGEACTPDAKATALSKEKEDWSLSHAYSPDMSNTKASDGPGLGMP